MTGRKPQPASATPAATASARPYPPGQAEAIRAGLADAGWSFLPFVFGVDDAEGRRDQLRAALARYTAAMARHHLQDQVIAACEADGP